MDAANRATMANVLTIRLGTTWEQMNAARNLSMYEDKYFYVHANHNPEHLPTSDSYRDSELGDLRISFEVTPPYPVTVCAQQQGKKLSPFFVSKTREEVFLLEDGVHSVDELFDQKTETKVYLLCFACHLGKKLITTLIGSSQHILSTICLFGGVYWLSRRSSMAAFKVWLWLIHPESHFRCHQQCCAHIHSRQSELGHLQVYLCCFLTLHVVSHLFLRFVQTSVVRSHLGCWAFASCRCLYFLPTR